MREWGKGVEHQLQLKKILESLLNKNFERKMFNVNKIENMRNYLMKVTVVQYYAGFFY